jgi:hypothetical protein
MSKKDIDDEIDKRVQVLAQAAQRRSDAIYNINRYASLMNDHITKILFWGNTSTANHHWKSEILAFIKNMYDIKLDIPSGPKFNKTLYVNLVGGIIHVNELIGNYNDNDEMIKSVPSRYTIGEAKEYWGYLHKALIEFYSELAELLTSKKPWQKTKAEVILDKLLLSFDQLETKIKN